MKKNLTLLLVLIALLVSFSVIFADDETIEITFDDDSFLDFVFIPDMDEADASDFSIVDGIYDVQHQTMVTLPIETGTLVHYRVKSKTFGEDGPLFMMDLNNSERYEEAFRLYAISSNDFFVDILRTDDFANLGFDGHNNISLDEWVDFVFYLSPDNVMYIFIFNANDDSGFLSTSVALPDEWQNKVWDSNVFIDYDFWRGQIDESELSLKIDFINFSTLPIEDYFAAYIVPAEVQLDEIHEVLTSEVPIFSDLEFWGYDGEMSEGGDEGPELDRDDLNVPFNLIHTVVENAQVVYGESAELMRDNQGGEFSFIKGKGYDENGQVFVFSTENEPAYLAFNTRMDEIDGVENESGKGFYMKFKPVTENLRFSFVSADGQEVGIDFEEDGSPFLYNAGEEIAIPFMSGETEPCTVVNEEWYHLFFAINDEAHLKALIWPVDDYLHNGGFADFTFENVDGESWQFMTQFDANGQIEVESYEIYSIEHFPSMFGE